ncbi:MAG: C25 family peptidase propeptide domain-containing protein [Calditrichaceae bacterium]
MKGAVFTYIILSCTILFAASGDYDITFKQLNMQSSEINYTLSSYKVDKINIEGQNFSKINFKSDNITRKKGYAHLPVISRAIQLPAQKNVNLIIKDVQYEDCRLDYPLIPSKGVIYRSNNIDNTSYNIDPVSLVNEWYPSEIAVKTRPYIVKDVRGTNIQIHPFQYNAQKNILRVYTHITLELVENTDTPTNPLYPANSFHSSDLQFVYESAFLNYEPQNKLAKSGNLTVQQLGDLLVITTPRDEEVYCLHRNCRSWKQCC